MDVKTAFLKGKLTKEVFIKQPEGFVKEGKENLVCWLKQNIYRLKQSPHCWNAAINDHLRTIKFVQTKGGPCFYVSTDGKPIIIAVYVDVILIAWRTDKRIAEVKNAIANWFDIKDIGELHYFLRVKVV